MQIKEFLSEKQAAKLTAQIIPSLSEKAVYNAGVLEELAKMAFLTLQINPLTSPIKQALMDKHYFRKHGAGAYYGQGC